MTGILFGGLVQKNMKGNTVVGEESFEEEKKYIGGMLYNNYFRLVLDRKNKHFSAASCSAASNF